MSGPVIGEGFVSRNELGDLAGVGRWCGFPFAVELRVEERRGKKGYRLILRAAPPGPLTDPDAPLPMPLTETK